ncbi:MAG: hypothetical protein ACI9EF_002663 [Pseudohongiellaceae bacterium]|jgi:hypothetical protein
MTHPPRITELVVSASSAADQRTGLMAWLRFRLYDQIVIDGIALRRSRDDRLILSWPRRRDNRGQLHHSVRPADDDARLALEAAVFEELGIKLEGQLEP